MLQTIQTEIGVVAEDRIGRIEAVGAYDVV